MDRSMKLRGLSTKRAVFVDRQGAQRPGPDVAHTENITGFASNAFLGTMRTDITD